VFQYIQHHKKHTCYIGGSTHQLECINIIWLVSKGQGSLNEILSCINGRDIWNIVNIFWPGFHIKKISKRKRYWFKYLDPWRNGITSYSRSKGCMFNSRHVQILESANYFLENFVTTTYVASKLEKTQLHNFVHYNFIHVSRNWFLSTTISLYIFIFSFTLLCHSKSCFSLNTTAELFVGRLARSGHHGVWKGWETPRMAGGSDPGIFLDRLFAYLVCSCSWCFCLCLDLDNMWDHLMLVNRGLLVMAILI